MKTQLPFPTRTGLLIESRLSSPAQRRQGKRNLRRNQLLGAYRIQGAMSRVEAARHLGFNLRTVSLLVDDLVRQNLLVEHESRITASGRRPIPLTLTNQACSLLGAYVRKEFTTMALMDLAGEELGRTQVPNDFATTTELGDWLFDKISKWLTEFGESMPPLGGVGLSLGGVGLSLVQPDVSPERATESMDAMVKRHEKITDYMAWVSPVRDRLEVLLSVPVVAEHDSYLTALGERWFGAGRGKNNMAVFDLSDGLGFAVIQNGQFFRGARNWSGEMGHLPLGQAEIPCYCGSSGCLENILSVKGLLRAAAFRGITVQTVAELAEKARDENDIAIACFQELGEKLALAVAISITLYNPEIVVFGGHLAPYKDLYTAAFESALPRLAVPFILADTQIVWGTLGENAITHGTCAVLLQKIFGTDNARVEELL